MTRWMMFLVWSNLVALGRAKTGAAVTSEMNWENIRILKREQSGGTAASTRHWSCEQARTEMARYGHKVMDCLMHSGCAWFRIDTPMTWQESWQACHAIAGGNLASVHDASEYGIVRQLYWFDNWKNAGNWLGLNKIIKEPNQPDAYQWSDGTTLDYRKWIPPQQANESDNNCVLFSTHVGNSSASKRHDVWIDGFDKEDCNQPKMPICKVTNPSGI